MSKLFNDLSVQETIISLALLAAGILALFLSEWFASRKQRERGGG